MYLAYACMCICMYAYVCDACMGAVGQHPHLLQTQLSPNMPVFVSGEIVGGAAAAFPRPLRVDALAAADNGGVDPGDVGAAPDDLRERLAMGCKNVPVANETNCMYKYAVKRTGLICSDAPKQTGRHLSIEPKQTNQTNKQTNKQ
jgi:hypothetical protein